MPVQNKEIADILIEIADLLEIKGENQFRVQSYRNAARSISELSENIAQKSQKEIKSIPDIGESMAEKIREISKTGRLTQLEELKEDIPPEITDIMKLEQMGPQKTKTLYNELGISSIEELKEAAEDGEIEELDGFGEKTAENILREIETFSKKGGSKRHLLRDAELTVDALVDYLKDKIKNVTVAGSFRRRKDTVGDIDILGTSDDPEKAMEHFVGFDQTDRVLAQGDTKSSIKLRTGLQVDFRIVDEEALGAALLYFTGSKAHSIALRKLAREKNYKVNEYGIFKGEKKLASDTEEAMYKKLGLSFIEPELREDRGEIGAAKKDKLPELITLEDIRGDLHSHTEATDGNNSLEEMAEAAQRRGYDYFAVTDHSQKVRMANGLDEKRLRKQIEAIDSLNEEVKIRVLKSIEVDILEDGSLDLPDDVLKDLDLVVASVHYKQNLSSNKQTKRIIKAIEHPHVNIIGHPTGRIIGKRSEYDLDMEAVMKAAKDQGCFLEVNATPVRLDLNDHHVKKAQEIGLKLVVSTDAHSTRHLEYMKYGVGQARRGWLEPADVINTRSWQQLKSLLKK